MKNIKGFLLALMLVGMSLMTATIPAKAATPTEINDAIAAGLSYLATQQAAGGYWSGGYYPVAATGLAVLAFENNGHLPTGDPLVDPYVTVVRNGLDYLFANAYVTSISVQPAGDPDTNGNGYGIYFSSGNPVYETGIVMMTIVASQAPTRVATTGPDPQVKGRTYHDILTDVVDYIAWAQADSTPWEGGWRYSPNDGADNSVTQWPTIGLDSAELWGVNAPAWVKTELLKWLTYTQNLIGDPTTNTDYGGFCYGGGYAVPTWWVNVAKTGAGIACLDYCDVLPGDSRVQAAMGYLDRHWTDTSDSRGYLMNFGNLYGMYAVMKGCRLANPPITMIGAHEWYNGAGEYADWLVAHQALDGSWPSPIVYGNVIYNTAWAILILQYIPVVVRYDLTVNVVDDSTGLPISGATVDVTAGPEPTSGTTDGGSVTFHIQAGDYSVTASMTGYTPATTPVHLFSDTTITIRLTPIITPVIPEVPFGTLMILLSMFIALVGFAGSKRFRPKFRPH